MRAVAGGSIQPSSRVARSEAILFTELDDTVVMMDTRKGRYYELDPVGARTWALLESEPRVAEVCDALAAEYDVDPDTCRDDVLAFLDELADHGVIRVWRPDGREGDGGVANEHTTKRAANRSADTPPGEGGGKRV